MQQMKKMTLLMMVFTLLLTVAGLFASDSADARRGGFKAPRKTYTEQPNRATDNVRNTDNAKAGTTAGAGAATGSRGFFSGGSLMKGLMIGGLAGLLFGSMFAGMGFLGDFLGLLINVLAIYFLFVLVRSAIQYFRNRRRVDDNRRPY